MSVEVARSVDLPSYTPPEKGFKLTSNGGAIEEESTGLLKETPKDAPVELIKERYMNDGYVLVKGLLPVEAVRKMRKAYFDFVKCTGVLKEGTDPVDGIFVGGNPNKYGGPGSAATGEGTLDPQQIKFLTRATEAHYAEFYEEFQKSPGGLVGSSRCLSDKWLYRAV